MEIENSSNVVLPQPGAVLSSI